jgi:hypothetical protein
MKKSFEKFKNQKSRKKKKTAKTSKYAMKKGNATMIKDSTNVS